MFSLGTDYQVSDWLPLWDGKAPGKSPDTTEELVISEGHISRIPQPVMRIWTAPEKKEGGKPALIIFPGGGYGLLAIEKEGCAIARWAADQGMAGIVVKYRVSNQQGERLGFPVPLIEARRAIRIVRHQAEQLNVNPQKIGVIGFSAGGHLAGMCATTWNEEMEMETGDEIDNVSARPDFAMLIYPCVSLLQPYSYPGIKHAILDRNSPDNLVEMCSPEKRVNKQTPPLFLIHAFDDPVSCMNSIDMARATHQAGANTTFHLYPKGGHGYGMEKRNQPTDEWPLRAAEWLKVKGIIQEANKPQQGENSP